jgi:hypothetical protein
MHFTVVFGAGESSDRSYGLVFIPNPCWVRGSEIVLNLNPRTPELEPGAVRRLIDQERLRGDLAEGGNTCTLIAHPAGHGTLKELHLLQEELAAESLSVRVVGP